MDAHHNSCLKDDDIFEPSSNTSLLGNDTRFRNVSNDTNRSVTSTEEVGLSVYWIEISKFTNDSST